MMDRPAVHVYRVPAPAQTPPNTFSATCFLQFWTRRKVRRRRYEKFKTQKILNLNVHEFSTSDSGARQHCCGESVVLFGFCAKNVCFSILQIGGTTNPLFFITRFRTRGDELTLPSGSPRVTDTEFLARCRAAFGSRCHAPSGAS
jgi:hypothetical protein